MSIMDIASEFVENLGWITGIALQIIGAYLVVGVLMGIVRESMVIQDSVVEPKSKRLQIALDLALNHSKRLRFIVSIFLVNLAIDIVSLVVSSFLVIPLVVLFKISYIWFYINLKEFRYLEN